MKSLKSLLVLAVLCLHSSIAKADGYAGIFLGPSFVNNDIGTGFIWGGHIGGKLTEYFSLGFYASHQSLASASIANDDGSSASIGVSETILAIEPNFYPVPNIPVYIGAKIGMGILSGTLALTDNDENEIYINNSHINFAAGPAIGTDIPVAPNFSVGGEFNAVFVTTSGAMLNLINLLATATFHF